jgi:hypothetical protein
MHEHDDDLESEVEEGAEKETDSYPNTGDVLDEPLDESSEDDEDFFDEDEAEL